MKQHISEEQWNELDNKKKNNWFCWAVEKGYTKRISTAQLCSFSAEEKHEVDVPNIGRMIEFLDEMHLAEEIVKRSYYKNLNYLSLCDALWEAVKEVLNKYENK